MRKLWEMMLYCSGSQAEKSIMDMAGPSVVCASSSRIVSWCD